MVALSPTSVLVGTNMKMPVIGIGTWQGTDDDVQLAVNEALEAGYRHIDTARAYRNESGIGKVLREWFESGRLKREDVFVVTKCHPSYFRPEHIEKSLDDSLAKLQLDYVDLYLAHNPVGWKYIDEGHPFENGELKIDMNTDIIANWKVFEDIVDKGKAKAVGVSNFNKNQIRRILDAARIKPANNQVELYVYLQQPDLVNYCMANGITICAYGPIGSPNLKNFMDASRLGSEGMTITNPMQDPVVTEIAQKHRKTPAQVLLRFLLQYGVAVIPKSSNPDRIRQNIDVFDFELSPEEFNALKGLDRGEAGRQFGGASGMFKDMSKHPEYPHPR